MILAWESFFFFFLIEHLKTLMINKMCKWNDNNVC